MDRFEHVLNPPSGSPLHELYDQIVSAGLGDAVPWNFFCAQGTRPDILAGTWALVQALLLRGQLSPRLKQLIVVTVSVHNDCRYCTVTHTHALEALGASRDTIEECVADLDSPEIAEDERAILKFARKAASQPREVTDADFALLRLHGTTDGEILEVVMLAAFSNFINTWADVSRIAVDQPRGTDT
jgi:uncharacterized peroxidase-related enzyme